VIDFGLTEDEEMVVSMAERFGATELRPTAREREARGSVEAGLHAAFSAAGLDLLARDHADASEVSLAARAMAIEHLAHADAGAAIRLWFGALSAAWGERLGVAEVGFVHLVDGLREDLRTCLPVGSGGRILLVEPSGGWWVIAPEAVPARALGLQSAGPAWVTVGAAVEEGRATPEQLARLVAEIRLFAASALVGIARASRDHAEHYVQERVAFGQRLADHQGVAFLVAEVAMGVEGASLLAHRAATDLQAGDPTRATDAYLEAVEVALSATSTGVQLLGGHGFMKEHPVEKWMRDARALSLLWGGVDAARRDAAAEVG